MTSTPWSSRASQTTSAPIRVRRRGRASSSIARRAASTAAAWAVPSPGMWLRRAGGAPAPLVEPASAGLGGDVACPFVIVIGPCLPSSVTSKNPRHPARVPLVCGGSSRLASVPPCPSVLPPGAGNEKAEKAVKTDQERAKKGEERTVGETRAVQRHLDAPTVRRHDDGDLAAIAAIEQTQCGLP